MSCPFAKPWFLDRKLALGVSLYEHQWLYESPHSIYDDIRTGMTLSLRRALWSDFLEGTIRYTLEDVNIQLNSGFHGDEVVGKSSHVNSPKRAAGHSGSDQ